MQNKHASSPLDYKQLEQLHAGDTVLLSGVIYTARDAAHKRLSATIKDQGIHHLPISLESQTIYYMGPSPCKQGQVIGSCGPTTSARMDSYTHELLSLGLRAMIGKGERSQEIKLAIQQFKSVYFVTYGGVGALLASTVRKAETVAYPELGAEAMLRLEVENFPLVTAYDMRGGDLFATQISKYRRT